MRNFLLFSLCFWPLMGAAQAKTGFYVGALYNITRVLSEPVGLTPKDLLGPAPGMIVGIKTRFTLHSKNAQHTLSGYVYDQYKEPLTGAQVYTPDRRHSAVSNAYGFFSMKIPAGRNDLIASYFLTEADTIAVDVYQDTSISFFLPDKMIQAVTITAQRSGVERVEMGVQQLSIKQIKKIPSLGGETDVMRALSFLPGVSNGSEGSAGLYVRGGTPDQNLILLDHATVYNPNHIFGFLSVFNPDAIKHVELYRGGFPARYGGRIASILDIQLKEGNRKKWRGEGGIGLISSRALAEGPIWKGKGSVLAAGRASYLSLLFLPARLQYNAGSRSDLTGYYMYDVNIKANVDISPTRRLFAGVYAGNDQLNVFDKNSSDKTESTLRWGNRTATLRYVQELKPDFFWKNILAYSYFKYRYGVTAQHTESNDFSFSSYKNESALQEGFIKSEGEYTGIKRHFLRIGMEHHLFQFTPRALTQSFSNPDTAYRSKNSQNVQALESAVYVEDEWKPTQRWTIGAGLRIENFASKGARFLYPEPRLSVAFKAMPQWAFKASYGRFQQSIHLLSAGGLGFQNDVWAPATAAIPSQTAAQWSVGTVYFIPSLQTEITLEFYSRRMNRQAEYKEGVSILTSGKEDWESLIESGGTGRSDGIEWGVAKKEGRLTGLFAYTYSKTTRQFANLNNGAPFPFRYDFRHNLNATVNFQIRPKWDISLSHVWRSGQPYSFPVAAFHLPDGERFQGGSFFYYRNKNNIRLPDYIRTDMGLNYSKVNRKKRTVNWNFSVYNVFNRQNPFYAQIENKAVFNYEKGRYEYFPNLRIKSLLPILPSFGYAVKF